MGEKGIEKGIGRPPRFLSAQEVADRYGLTVQWVYHCEGLKKIARKVGKYLRYREDEVEAFEQITRDKTRGNDLVHLRNFMRQMSETTKIAKNRKSLIFDLND